MLLKNFNYVIEKLPINEKRKKITIRRIKKLQKNPKGFFIGSYTKRSSQIKDALPIKYYTKNSYTIVTAVFNSEKYLDHYFHSIVNQSLDFKRNIRIICIDDGSTDQSADIIKSWIKKYPKNITYLFKENGGQASARNLGLKKVNSDWVTFIDSDDFLAKDYFYQVDKAIVDNENIKAVSCNQIYYIEESDQYVEGHPLKYRFKTENNLVPCNDLKKNVQFSTALIFLKTSSIPSFLTFDESLRPTFEDGKFVNTYLLSQSKDSLIYFHPKAKYFNRKREDKSSTMDNVWIDKRQFNVVLQEGYLNLLSTTYDNLGYVPEFIQRTILWEILRLVKRLMNREERVNFLTVEEKDNLIELIRQTFKYIDESTILNYELGRPGFSRQLGMLGCFKGVDVSKQVVYIDEIDHTKKQFLTRFFSSFDPLYQVYTDSGEIFPLFVKKTDRMFLSERFLTEYRVWLPIPEKGVINVSIDQKNASITYLDHKYKNGLDVSKLVVKNVKKQDIWLLMDRDDRAGDNAEFLYKYLKKNDCTQSIYFILDRKSIDWDRLHEEGFNLISHGSSEHKNLLEECSLVISSQTNRLIEPFENINKNYKIVFLQHGVIKDDLSNWLNTVDMNLMLTSSYEEYNSIVGDHSTYKYGEKEIKLTGLPRFDSLYNNRNRQVNKVLIMFTWRRGIAGNFINRLKSEREFNTDFVNTDYYMRINKLLKNNKMKDLAFKDNLSFVLCPHPNMNNYLQCFDIPEYIEIAQEEDLIHNLINDSSILITDYSSIAFDFAYQNKPVLYYQFDKDDFYSGNHTYTEGYFSYEEKGFGPVITTEANLLDNLEIILKNNNEIMEPYVTRIQDTFAYRDTNNCKRVYEAILDLDSPDTPVTSVEKIIEYAEKAIAHEAWDLALERINNALQHSDITQAQVKEITQIKESVLQTGYQDEPVKLAKILWQEGRIEEALDALKQIDDIEASDELLRLRVKLAILNNDFILARDSQKLLLENYNEQCTTEDWQFYTQLASI